MVDRTEEDPDGLDVEEVEDTPVLACSRCDREWALDYELDTLQAGNRAVEQFALDHKRHTGHYPDAVTPWLASCRRCPAGEAFLAERPAKRWARTHARHTDHRVSVEHGDAVAETVEAPGGD